MLPLAKTNITRKYIALNHELKGKALTELGSSNEAIAAIETAVSLADEIQYQPIRWSGRHQLFELYKQNDREKDAQQTSSEAQDIIRAIAESLEDETLRNTFVKAVLPK